MKHILKSLGVWLRVATVGQAAEVASVFTDHTAEIVEDTVVVTSDTVTNPVAVRFGWTNVPETNLFKKNGLPATPFRTKAP